MATEIKAIQCPKCGSTQKYEVRPGDFKCASCGTEYFVDNGTVNFSAPPPPPTVPPPATRTKWGAVLGLFSFIIIIIVIFAIESGSDSSSGTSSSSSSSSPEEDYSISERLLYTSADKRPILVVEGSKTTMMGSEKKYNYIALFDVAKDEEITRVPMPGATSTGPTDETNFDVKAFSNGDVYMISNSMYICIVRKGSYSVEEITKTIFENQPELVSGVAKVDFTDDYITREALRLITNDGKTYFYFPISNKLYTKDSVEKMASPDKDNTEKTGFDFTASSHFDIADETTARLFKYRYSGQRERSKNYLFEEFLKTNDSLAFLKNYGITSVTDFTPGRIYFGMEMLYYDDDYVLISYKITPVQKAQRFVQCLNARTGSIVFTTKLNNEDYPPDAAVRYADGFAMTFNQIDEIFSVNMHGALQVNRLKMYDKK